MWYIDMKKPTLPSLNVNGVTLTESAKISNVTCLTSTLTFTGTLFNLTQLAGAVLKCNDLNDTVLKYQLKQNDH